MTNVGRPSDGQTGAGIGNFSPRDMLGDGRAALDRRHGDLASLADRLLEADEDSPASARCSTSSEADFLECFRVAIDGRSGDTKNKGGDTRRENLDDRQVIATAEQRNWTFLPPLADMAPALPGARTDAIEAKVSLVTETIERAIQAEMAPQPGQPLNVHIDLADADLSLAGINLTVSPLNIDVVLLRTGSVVSPELIGAAQALADRLVERFSKRAVRVLHSSPSSASASRQFPVRGIPSSHDFVS